MRKTITSAGCLPRHLPGCSCRRRSQRGFSILEILIATVLISSLVASGLYFVNLGDKTNLVDLTAIKTSVAVRFPEALVSIYAREQSFVGVTKADLIGTGSVRDGIPLGWTIASGDDAPTRDTLKLTLTFGNGKDAEILKEYLEDNKDLLMVTAAEVSASDKKLLSITYGIN